MPKTGTVLGIGAGVGVIGLAVYFAYSEYLNNEMIKEYMSEVEELEVFYRNAIADGTLSDAELAGIEMREKALAVKEVKLERKGIIAEVIAELSKFGIVVSAGYISVKIVKFFMDHHKPPPPYKCEICGASFQSVEILEKHIKQYHGVNTALIPQAEAAFRALSQTWQRTLAGLSGVGGVIWNSWSTLPVWAYILIATACIVLIVLSWGSLSPALVPVAVAAI